MFTSMRTRNSIVVSLRVGASVGSGTRAVLLAEVDVGGRQARAGAVEALELLRIHLDAEARPVGQLQLEVADLHACGDDVVHQQLRAEQLAAEVPRAERGEHMGRGGAADR